MNTTTKEEINALTGKNPYFKHINRAPYELGRLLMAMPKYLSSSKKYEPEIYQMADAAESHAANASNTLLHGLESIGNLITKTGLNEEYPIDSSDLVDLGELIRHISVELQFLRGIESDMHEVVKGGSK